MRISKVNQLLFLLCFISLIFGVCYAFADETVVAPSDFFTEVLKFAQSLGGLSWAAKIAGSITLILSSMKVSFLNQWVWSKLGAFKVWMGPVLGLVLGLVSMDTFSWSGAVAYALSGAGAVFFHEILDSVKAIPGLGTAYVSGITMVESLLGGPASQKT